MSEQINGAMIVDLQNRVAVLEDQMAAICAGTPPVPCVQRVTNIQPGSPPPPPNICVECNAEIPNYSGGPSVCTECIAKVPSKEKDAAAESDGA